jgi:hypothetical protein
LSQCARDGDDIRHLQQPSFSGSQAQFSSILVQDNVKPGAVSSRDRPQEGIADEYHSSPIVEQAESITTLA